MADSLYEAGDLNKSLELFKRFENNSVNNFKIAKIYCMLKEYKNALPYIQSVIEMDADNDEAFCIRGLIYGFLGNSSKSINDFDQAISLDSNNFNAHYYKGQFLLLDELFEESIVSFSEAIRIKRNGEAFYYRGVAKAALNNKVDACQDFSKAINNNCTIAISVFDDYCR